MISENSDNISCISLIQFYYATDGRLAYWCRMTQEWHYAPVDMTEVSWHMAFRYDSDGEYVLNFGGTQPSAEKSTCLNPTVAGLAFISMPYDHPLKWSDFQFSSSEFPGEKFSTAEAVAKGWIENYLIEGAPDSGAYITLDGAGGTSQICRPWKGYWLTTRIPASEGKLMVYWPVGSAGPFVLNPEGTYGTEIPITGSGFGSKKGKVFIGGVALKVDEWRDDFIRCSLMKALDPATYDVVIYPAEPKGILPITYEGAFVVKPAGIHSIKEGEGSAYDKVTIQGKFFGMKKGKVYLEYEENGEVASKSCKVEDWDMDPVTNDSRVLFVVPKMSSGICSVIVAPYGTTPDAGDEEEDGFRVKDPEIVSITPNPGSVSNQITVSGNYFGTKKPKLSFGSVSSGKRTNCSIVSWNDDEIVFTVPKLPPGTYDVTVTNSVGSVTLAGGFIIQ